jgi:hypothetical protein
MQTNGELCIKYGIVSFKILVVHFCNIFLVDASQKNPIFCAKKMKNEFFVQQKLKIPRSTLFVIPRCTHVQIMGLFEQTMP